MSVLAPIVTNSMHADDYHRGSRIVRTPISRHGTVEPSTPRRQAHDNGAYNSRTAVPQASGGSTHALKEVT